MSIKKCGELSAFNYKMQTIVEMAILVLKTINLDITSPYPILF